MTPPRVCMCKRSGPGGGGPDDSGGTPPPPLDPGDGFPACTPLSLPTLPPDVPRNSLGRQAVLV